MMPNRHNPTMARTEVRVPVIIGSPLKISELRVMYREEVSTTIELNAQEGYVFSLAIDFAV
jgi:hypothetical protein